MHVVRPIGSGILEKNHLFGKGSRVFFLRRGIHVSFAFSKCLRRFVDGAFAVHWKPCSISGFFQESAGWILRKDVIDNGLGDQNFAVFGTAPIVRTIRSHQRSKPRIARMGVSQSASATQNVAIVRLFHSNKVLTMAIFQRACSGIDVYVEATCKYADTTLRISQVSMHTSCSRSTSTTPGHTYHRMRSDRRRNVSSTFYSCKSISYHRVYTPCFFDFLPKSNSYEWGYIRFGGVR